MSEDIARLRQLVRFWCLPTEEDNRALESMLNEHAALAAALERACGWCPHCDVAINSFPDGSVEYLCPQCGPYRELARRAKGEGK